MEKIELLTPAGDLQRLKIAAMYGADAIYIGGKRFSLRSRASNFDMAAIAEGVLFAKQYQVAIHVTINMIPHEEDFEGLKEYVTQLDAIGVTAVIVASPYIVEFIKSLGLKIEIHLSTQQSITNHLAIEYYKSIGADRIVFARELSIEQVVQSTKKSSLPTEAFIHGGMCVNYSGRCTLSNYMTLRDANRGGCAQSCRWKYTLFEDQEIISDPDCMFSMSSKDMMALLVLPQLIDANVCSLKVEGRMKSAYYVATVVKTYRMMIDEYYQTKQMDDARMAFYLNEIAKAENRPTSIGFYHGIPTYKDHLYGVNGAGVTHDFLAYVLDYEDGYALVEVRNYFEKGDCFEVFGPNIFNQKYIVEEVIDQDGQLIEVCNNPMKQVRIKIPFKVEKHDMIRRGTYE